MKKKVDIFFHLKLQDTTYLNREILQGKSLQATTLYEWLFWYLSSNVFLEALFEQGTCVNNSHKAIFFAKKNKQSSCVSTFFVCAFLCVPVCTHTYLCVGICICWHMYSCMHIQWLEATIRYLPHLLCVFYLWRQILSRN